MQYYRCKCGKAESWGSMPPRPCMGCSHCNTTLTQHPDHHQTPEPHQYVIEYDQHTGKPYEICMNCSKKKPETEKAASAMKYTLEAGVELWKRWFDWRGSPWVVGERDIERHCFFCGAPEPTHDEPMCVYVSAKELVEADNRGEPG